MSLDTNQTTRRTTKTPLLYTNRMALLRSSSLLPESPCLPESEPAQKPAPRPVLQAPHLNPVEQRRRRHRSHHLPLHRNHQHRQLQQLIHHHSPDRLLTRGWHLRHYQSLSHPTSRMKAPLKLDLGAKWYVLQPSPTPVFCLHVKQSAMCRC